MQGTSCVPRGFRKCFILLRPDKQRKGPQQENIVAYGNPLLGNDLETNIATASQRIPHMQ
jgi:hypothetical protein